jgi:beta-glucosidase/6-phospho-beta-glucosidase/beta-galactosidase
MRRSSFQCLALAAVSSALSCGSSGESFQFPRGFLFGTGTAGFQVEMGCPTLAASVCEDPNSDWYVFVTSPAITGDPAARVKGDAPSLGPGHYELYAADFDRAKNELSNNAFRMSIEWSRIFPRATDGVEGYDALRTIASADALAHYHAVFAALRARGLKPFITLNHYTLPTWIHDTVACHRDLSTCERKGWIDRERTVREIAKYAGFCAREFGGEVDLWSTHNEAFTSIAIAGYLFQTEIRSNPPAVRLRYAEAKIVYQALVEAHARMYDAVKQNDTADADGDGKNSEVGIVYPMLPVRAKDPQKPNDVRAAENVFYLWNLAFLNAVVKGEIDPNFDQRSTVRPDLQNRMDFVGINYYGSAIIEGLDGPVFPDLSPLTTFNPLTFGYNTNDPKGIYEMVMLIKQMGKPVIISENGIQDPRDEGIAPEFLVRHLQWLWRAIEGGADVRGYFYWTLFDNYEWHLGLDFRMGLFAVDNASPQKTRSPRKAAAVYRRIASEGRIPADLIKLYPERKR